jgi:hypothetical protein
MRSFADNSQERQSRAIANAPGEQSRKGTYMVDNRPEMAVQRKMVEMARKYGEQKALQRKQMFTRKEAVQKKGPEDEDELQFKAIGAVQCKGPEDEDELQFKSKEAVQKKGPEDEDELQFKAKDAVQLKGPEDEDELQFKSKEAVQKKGPEGEDELQFKAEEPVQKQENKTGLPDDLKAGVENLSGMAMDDVRVHYNSGKPAQLNAYAYTQGSEIHVAPGQEKHLPHEAWHVVQQKQGRVQPTMQMKGGVAVNDDKGLESEADGMGKKTLQMKSNPSSVLVTGQNLPLQQGIVQRTLSDDKDRIGIAREIMLSTRQPLSDEFQKYGNNIMSYKATKANSKYREDSSKGLLHWAEHLNIACTGSLAEIKRVQHEGGLAYTKSEVPNWERRSRLGKDTKTEPDVITSYRNTVNMAEEKWAEEIKGVTSADYSAVGANIKKAIKQLDKPRASGMDYHRVIIYINNTENSWPWTSNIDAKSGKTTLEEEAEKRLTGFEHSKTANYKLRVNGITNYNATGNMLGRPGEWTYWSNFTTAKAKGNRTVEKEESQQATTKKRKVMTYDEPLTPEQNLS